MVNNNKDHSELDIKLSDVARSGLFLYGIGISVLVWFADPFIDTVFLHEGTLLQQLITSNTHEIYMRTVLSMLIIIFSIVYTKSFNDLPFQLNFAAID
jgi:hypothetical protein